MQERDFLDTNIPVYAYDTSDPAKQHIAQDVVRRAVAGEIVTSAQVLAEFAATLLHKLSPAARPADLSAILDALGPVTAIVADADTVRRAVEAHAEYGVHFYALAPLITHKLRFETICFRVRRIKE